MTDRGRFWSPVPDWSQAEIRREGLAVTARSAAAAWLVSGNLRRFLERHGAPCLGPRETSDAALYALRLAPDRLLFVCDGAASVPSAQFGWSADGIAITDVSDGYLLFDVTGPAAADLMALGASDAVSSAPAGPAESASMLFASLKTAIARHGAGWRLHVERPQAATMWLWLQQSAQTL